MELETELSSSPFFSLCNGSCKSLAHRVERARPRPSSQSTSLGYDPHPRQACACQPCFFLLSVFPWRLVLSGIFFHPEIKLHKPLGWRP